MRCRHCLFALSLALVSACKKKPPPPPEPVPHTVTHRCEPVSPEGSFVLGAVTNRPAGTDGGEPLAADALPFAAEVGDAVAFASGFAVGAIHAENGSPTMSVVQMGPDGRGATVVALGAARADVEPPRLAARGALLIAGVLEPEKSGRAIKLATIDSDRVSWGARVHEDKDESQVFDLAIGDTRGIVVWDEDAADRGAVRMSTFDPADPSAATPPRTISPDRSDAEAPRLVARPGGFWLGYLARRAESDDDDAEAHFQAEAVGFRWVEVIALDENGSPVGPARAVTPSDGHVMMFDMAPGPGDTAIVAWRDDDAPGGGAGGRVIRVVVGPASIDEPSVLVDDVAGAGAPNLVGSWLAIADATGPTRLGPMSNTATLAGPLVTEPDLGSGEPLAASGNTLLVARPTDRAVTLSVVRCNPDAPLAVDAAPP